MLVTQKVNTDPESTLHWLPVNTKLWQKKCSLLMAFAGWLSLALERTSHLPANERAFVITVRAGSFIQIAH